MSGHDHDAMKNQLIAASEARAAMSQAQMLKERALLAAAPDLLAALNDIATISRKDYLPASAFYDEARKIALAAIEKAVGAHVPWPDGLQP